MPAGVPREAQGDISGGHILPCVLPSANPFSSKDHQPHISHVNVAALVGIGALIGCRERYVPAWSFQIFSHAVPWRSGSCGVDLFKAKLSQRLRNRGVLCVSR
jgi:hypothetical protein